ncbi:MULTISPECIES: hypothetical protein [Actinomycetes]|uniref:hypothetical protein n=1 Tax=Corynebacterium sp. TaxID=1720 RepID=UPI002A90A8AC|nr:hypothetical protein [Corynebacterium sp.]MDY5786556.1 hypothetical protein [Corynebacterium sp.]
MARDQSIRRQFNSVFREYDEVTLKRAGKDVEIHLSGTTYPAKWTARSSQTDSPQIPISFKAVSTLKETHPNSEEVALLYTWVETSGAIFAVGLTVAQHCALTNKKIQAHDSESRVFTQAPGGYYIRRHASHPQWEQYCDLAKQGDLLFTLEMPAPIISSRSKA